MVTITTNEQRHIQQIDDGYKHAEEIHNPVNGKHLDWKCILFNSVPQLIKRCEENLKFNELQNSNLIKLIKPSTAFSNCGCSLLDYIYNSESDVDVKTIIFQLVVTTIFPVTVTVKR